MSKSKKWISVLLSFVMVLTMVPFYAFNFAPKAQAYSSYSKPYSTEYYYASGTKFIYQLILYYKNSGSSNDAVTSWLNNNGWTDWSGNFNAGDGHKSCYVHSGYKTTTNPAQAITGILVATGHPDSVSYGGATYYRVGGGFTTQTPTGGDGSVDLNKGNGGDDLYLMATADRAAGPALTAITKSQNGNSGTAQSNLTNNGYSVVTNQSGGAQDTNKGAGGDYNYCGQKSSCTTVNSDRLRDAYKYAKDCYENGGSAYSGLSSALNTASGILSDLNDGYTTSNQSAIDSATRALYDAMPSMSLNTQYTVSINTATMRRYYKFTPSEAGSYVFFSYGTSGDSRGYLYNRDATYGIGSTVANNDDAAAKIKALLGMGNNQYFFVASNLAANTTYYFYADFYSSNTGSFPMKVCKAVDVTFNATGGSGTFTQTLPAGHNGLKMSQSGITRANHTLIAWATSGSGAQAKSQMATATITVPSAATTYYALWNPTSAPTLSVNSDGTAVIDAGGEVEFYQFTPSVTRKYHFYGLSTTDTYALLYNASTWASSATYQSTSDDNGSGDFGQSSNQFRFTAELTAGTTYLYGVKYYNATATGSIPFRFEEIYKVEYDANGGSGAPTAQDKFLNKTLTLSATVPTRTGYTFKGWSTVKTATTATYAAGGSYTANADAKLYAVWEANKYNVTLNNQSATTAGTASVTATYDSAMPSATMPLKTGFTFGGYYSETNGGGTQYYTAAGASARTWNVAGASTLFAKWTENKYNIAFDGNGATGGSTAGISDVLYTASQTLTENGFTKTGYSFGGWNTEADGSGTTYADKASVSKLSAADGATVTLFAQWTINQYTMTVDPNGGSYNNSTANTEHKQDYATTKTVADATRTGYTFDGWTLAGKGAWDAESKTFTYGDGAGTLTANWTAHVYTVAFNGNGATGGETASIEKTYETDKALTVNGFEKTGYTFEGWATASDGAVVYADGATLTEDLTAENGATVDLYAVWTPIEYTLTLALDGGEYDGETEIKGYYESAAEIKDPTKLGYRFLGWTADKGGFADGVYTFTDSDATLTASWEAIDYTLIVKPDGGEYDGETTIIGNIGNTVTLGAPEKKGYTFDGWAITVGTNSALDGSVFTFWAEDAEVTAQYTAIDYTLTVDAAGGEYTGAIANPYHIGDTVNIPDPTKTGYDFAGWTVSAGTLADGDYTFTDSDATLTANWTAHTYTIAFNANGGTGEMTALDATYDAAQNLTANAFEKKGYAFKGWALTENGEKVYGDGAEVVNLTADKNAVVTLWAVWEAIPYTLSIDAAGGETADPASVTKIIGDEYVLATPEKEGYALTGWEITSGDGTVARDGETFTFKFTDSDAAVKAQWEAIVYTLTVDAAGGEYAGNVSVPGIIGDVVDLAKPVREGYTFLGWTADKGSVSADNAAYTFAASDATITAQWEAIDYTLTVDPNKGIYAGETEIVGHIGDTVTLSEPIREASDFVGWTADTGSVSGNEFTFGAADAVVTANWVVAKYNVVFENDVTGTEDTQIVEHGSAAAAPTAKSPVQKDGTRHYVFTGWDRSFDVITGATTIHAVYETVAHEWTLADRQAPTCDVAGYEHYICDCGEERTDILAAEGHSWSDVWTDDGNLETHTRVCLHDDKHTQTEEHKWDRGVVTVEPTCYTTGIIVYTCTVCGAQGAKPLDALGHEWTVWEADEVGGPDCTHGGGEHRACLRCGKEETREVPMYGHNPSGGFGTEGYCKECGEFVCESCDHFHILENTPGIGVLYKIIHFFIHTFHQIKYRT